MGGIDFFLTTVAHPEGRIARRGRLSGRRLQRVTDYIRMHLSENIRVDDLAAAAGLSAFHFARMFKRTTGLTPHRYLMRTRVERAMELVLGCQKSLTEIAAETGFFDQSHLARHFKRVFGATPSRVVSS